MVRKVGIEPTWYCYHQILSLERMPISPLSLFKKENRKAWYTLSFAHCKDKGFSKNYRTSRCSCFYFYCNETFVINMASRAGVEPATTWLTVRCSTDCAIEEFGPDDTIWTCDILLPKQALYQTELHLDNLNVEFCCFYDNQSPQPWDKIPTMPKIGVLAWLPWFNALNCNFNQRYDYVRLFCWNQLPDHKAFNIY